MDIGGEVGKDKGGGVDHPGCGFKVVGFGFKVELDVLVLVSPH